MVAGGLIDIEGGQLTGSSSYDGIWTSNLASMSIAAGATFDAVEAGPPPSLETLENIPSSTMSGKIGNIEKNAAQHPRLSRTRLVAAF